MKANKLSVSDLRDYCNEANQEISIVWGIGDVHQANEGTGHRQLSDEEALHILARVKHGHDCNQGISWETLDWHIEDYFDGQITK
jgi:hypothetical protein